MDIRLVIPAAGVWLGSAGCYWVTGLADGPVGRHDRAHFLLVLTVVMVILALSITLLIRRSRAGVAVGVAVVALSIGVGVAAWNIAAQTRSPISDWIMESASVDVVAVVTTEPRRVSTSVAWKTPEVQQVTVASTSIDAEPVQILLTVDIPPSVTVPPVGSHVVVSGKLGESFRYGNFAAALNGVDHITVVGSPGWIDIVAQSMRSGLRESLRGLDPNAGSLVAGLAIGDESALPADLRSSMKTSGLAHLTAVSGGNVAIVLALVLGLCMTVNIPLVGRVLTSLGALAFYVVLVQPQPSVLRAAVMGGIVVLALLVGGRRAGPSILSAAVLILILMDPSLSIAWGFALSVSATAGIIVLSPYLLLWAGKTRGLQRLPPVVLAAATLTLAAQLATLPVMIAMGVPLSSGSVPANIAAMPMVPLITIGGLLSSVISPIALSLGHVFATISSWPAAWIVMVATYFGQWPTFTGAQLLVSVILMAGLVVVARRLRRPEVIAIAPIALVLFLVARTVTLGSWVPSTWFMVACDVGQGDALVLKDQQGKVVVVDVGPEPALVDRCLEQLEVSAVEAVLVSHYHRDHVGGLAGVVQGRRVGGVYATTYQEPQDQYEYAESVLSTAIPLRVMRAGQVWNLGETTITVLWPERILQEGSVPNNASVVLLYESHGRRILLTGDIEREAQRAIMRSNDPVQADIVKVPHHGSANVDPEFATWAGGEIAIFSVGADNDYGHPSAEALHLWSQAQQFRTDRQGSIALSEGADGQVVVTSEK